eukprot:1156886-Pelagomonas_calceolata.AAC.5
MRANRDWEASTELCRPTPGVSGTIYSDSAYHPDWCAGTIYNECAIKPLVNLGQTKHHKAKSLAFNSRGLWGGVAGRGEVDTRRRRVWASKGMADNPLDPH